MSRFSVLLSLYHKESPSHLQACFNSLVNQTLLADQVVLVIDGKIGQELEKVIAEFKNALPLTLVRLPNNVGLGLALNEGLKHCLYEWVLRMDTDDVCVPARFELQMAFIKNHHDVAVVGGQIIEFDGEDEGGMERGILKSVPLTHQQITQWAKKRNPFNHMTIAYKKSVVLAVGGYQHHLFMEDYNLWLRLLSCHYQMANMPNVLVYARTGSDMIGRRKGVDYIKSEWALFRLKNKLNINNKSEGVFIFILRVILRLLPVFLLQHIYLFLRLLRN